MLEMESRLKSETLKSAGVKTGRVKVDETDSSQSSLDELDINASQFTVSCFILDAFNASCKCVVPTHLTGDLNVVRR